MTPDALCGQTRSHLRPLTIGGQELLAHPDAHAALAMLAERATEAGFELAIVSGFRDYQRQAAIWNAKFSGERPVLDSDSKPLDTSRLSDSEKITAILRWSALPGASRHHWGCDFDLCASNCLPEGVKLMLEPWEYLTGHQQAFYNWLRQTLPELGFFFPYDQDRGGVAPEPWHISYAPVSEPALASLTPEILTTALRREPIAGLDAIEKMLPNIYTRFITNTGAAL